ncbi:phosphate acyltransferase [Micractinium conductrix]|uniref:Tafazzin family protein n=1 Tax=Micractinium conductrix TaxID=554055 RepID=A0A2P6V9P3_9CHLO|nr:phosphate acyltransferase [Micractinium conductrix]|eukprot:PSC70805.1 phosphate acyltransferase [Micractinium conductrix]
MDGLVDVEDHFAQQALQAPWGEVGRSATLGVVSLFSKLVLSVLNSFSVEGVDTFLQHTTAREEGRGLITVCNHTSTVDDPMVFCNLLPASFFFSEHRHSGNRWSLCAKELCYCNPLLGAFFQSGKTLPIERGGGPDQPIMRTVASEVARGRWVHIFPEGRVNHTGQMGPLRWGVGKLVCDARLRGKRDPVVLPFYHSGMGHVMPKHAVVPRPGHQVHVVVGEPMDLADLTCRCGQAGEDQRAVWRDITHRIGEQLRALEKRAPPNRDQIKGGAAQHEAERRRRSEGALPEGRPGEEDE